jgi:hypothetical protein
MKCTIIIKGQIGGNSLIFRNLLNYQSVEKRFNGQRILADYNTLKIARADLQDAYKKLVEDEPDFEGIEFDNKSLEYDASNARIVY